MATLICPKCGKNLNKIGTSYICGERHCYDIAKDGHINLMPANKKNSKNPGDNKDMMAGRQRMLSLGYYNKLSKFLDSKISKKGITILDVGCGEGYITRELRKTRPKAEIIGLDISKSGITIASKQEKNVIYAVASANKLPIKSDSCNVVINAFAPLYEEEVTRVLSAGGLLIKVVPAELHLWGLKKALYEEPYKNVIKPTELTLLKEVSTTKIVDSITVYGEDVAHLIAMTPYAFKSQKEALQRVSSQPELTTEIEFLVTVYQKI